MEGRSTVSVVLDNHPPITEIEIGEPKYTDDRGIWITSESLISLNLVQQSTYGTTRTYYRIDGRGWQQYGRPFTVTGSDGPHQISYYSLNASGVTEDMKTIIVIKDDAPPSTRGAQASSPESEIQVNVNPATDPEEPVASDEETIVVIEEPDPVEEEPAPSAEEEPAASAEDASEPALETGVETNAETTVQTSSAPM